ncbi:MAG TPA: PIN domain-containing protein [Candidatus Acidoferrum sp.]|nr:PIN domain-containing protein [Candidatus Acidoferrum sp.]
MNILIDTSVWSLALRRKSADLSATERLVVAELSELIGEGRARIIGLVRQELLSGIKAPAQFEKLRSALIPFPDEPVETSDHEAAAKASNDCRAKGVVVSIVDVLICAIALRRGWHIFTTDPDFRHYARILPIKWHAPRE